MFDRIKKVDGGRRFSKVSTHDPIFIDTLINKKNESIRKSYQPKDDVSDDIQFLDNDSISNKSEELKINIECFPEMEGNYFYFSLIKLFLSSQEKTKKIKNF